MKKALLITLALVFLVGCVQTTGEKSAEKSLTADMAFIPRGEFKMGCDPDHNGGFSCPADELPLHSVFLDAFYIDKTEVTNSQYADCVGAGVCKPPSNTSAETRAAYYEDPAFANYPVVYVTWKDAESYCTWAGKRLPTEAEWEKAARGKKVLAYPWGDEPAACTLSNLSGCTGDTSEVGSLPGGASKYGVMDMAGNVWEWVSDWYSETYYRESPRENPTGPAGSNNKVLRGGSWGSAAVFVRAPGRSYDPDFNNSKDVGFRCVVSKDAK